MKLEMYKCDRCGEEVHHKKGDEPITITDLDGRYDEEADTRHLCYECYSTFLVCMRSNEKSIKVFDKLAEKFSGVDDE